MQDNPLVYASIYVTERRHGSYSDIDGHFSLSVRKEDKLLVISHIGYTNDTISISTLPDSHDLNVKLDDNDVDIPPITILSTKNIQKGRLGYFDDPVHKFQGTSYSVHHGYIVASYIKNDLYGDCTISKIKVRFYEVKYEPVVRIRFYEPIHSDNIVQPGREIIYNLPLYSVKKKKFKVDVKSNNITIPKEGLFIAIELISGGEYFDDFLGSNSTYPKFRFSDSQSEFLSWNSYRGKRWGHLKRLHRNSQRPLNLMIGADVIY